ncbi:hypothetical protein TCAL_14614 [Tigriopus californicus]|uniref:Centromere protein O n=1 Tax=Tigriopus californicus TaxID=6832 RepID=A0A553PB69_TIGCA|nr:hypothetical protein TCAL_14614 [Tigriopus californicus]
MEDYTVLGRIGEGAHGVVMKARHKKSGSIVALKKVLLKRLEDGIPETALREIKALQDQNLDPKMSFPAPEKAYLDLLNDSQRALEVRPLREEIQTLVRQLKHLRDLGANLRQDLQHQTLHAPRHYYPQAFRSSKEQSIFQVLNSALDSAHHSGPVQWDLQYRPHPPPSAGFTPNPDQCLNLVDGAARMRLFAQITGLTAIQSPNNDWLVLQFSPSASGLIRGPYQVILKHDQALDVYSLIKTDLPLSSKTLNLEEWTREYLQNPAQSPRVAEFGRSISRLLTAYVSRMDQVERMKREISEDIVKIRPVKDYTVLSFYLKIEVSDETGMAELNETTDPSQKMTIKVKMTYDPASHRPQRDSVVIGGGRSSTDLSDEDLAILKEQCIVFYDKDLVDAVKEAFMN